MRSRDFVYWLQGYFEIAGENANIDKHQQEIIKKHLAMVFVHDIDPSFGKDQTVLDEIHNGPKKETTPSSKFTSEFSPSRKVMC